MKILKFIAQVAVFLFLIIQAWVFSIALEPIGLDFASILAMFALWGAVSSHMHIVDFRRAA